MRPTFRNTVITLLLVVQVCSAGAEPISQLTLEQAVAMALEQHPGLIEADAEIRAAEARRAGAGLPSNPELVARIESAPLRTGTTSEAEYVTGISQAIPLGKRLSAAKEVAAAELDTTKLERQAEVWRIRKNVHDAFATALFSAEVIQVQTNLAASIAEFHRVTKLRVEHGDQPPLDLPRVAAEDAQTRLTVAESTRNYATALRNLRLALGVGRPVTSVAGKLEDTLNLTSVQSALTNTTFHPEVALAESREETEQRRLRAAKAARVPDLNFDLLYRRLEGPKEHAFDAGVSVAIPIFDRNNRVREAEHKLTAARARADRARMEVAHDKFNREESVRQLSETARLLRNEVIPKTDEALRGAEVRYRAGDLALSELVLVQREAGNARLQYLATLRAIMEAWSASRDLLR